MKKYLVFSISFLVLYILIQISSGLILTAFYTPDFSSAGQEIVFGQTTYTPFLMIFISATIAYLLSQKLGKTPKTQ